MSIRTILSIGLLLVAALAWSALFSAPPAALAAGTNSIETPDNSGDVNGADLTSIVLDTAGRPVASYSTTSGITVLHCGDVTCSAGNNIEYPEIGTSVTGSSIRLDSSGNPVVAYYTFVSKDLRVLHCNDTDCAPGGDSINSPDTVGDVGNHQSLALDSGGNPVVSYYDATNGNLKVLHCGNANCSAGNVITSPDTVGNVGQYTSLALDVSGNPVISYRDVSNADLKVLHCGDTNCSAGNSIQSPDTPGDVGLYTSLALDVSGNPVVSYSANNPSQEHPKVLHCGNANCGAGNVITDVDPGSTIFWGTSLRLDAAGNPVVAYNDSLGSDQIKVLHCGNATCNSGNTITFDFNNTPVQGFVASLAIDSLGKPVVAYVEDGTDNLNVLHCGDAICSRDCPITNLPLPAAGCTEFTTSATLVISSIGTCGADGVADFTRSAVGDSNFNGRDDVVFTKHFITGYIDCPGPYTAGAGSAGGSPSAPGTLAGSPSITSMGTVDEVTNTSSGYLEFPAEGDFQLCLTVYTSTALGTVENCPASLGAGAKDPLQLHCSFASSFESGFCTVTAVSKFYPVGGPKTTSAVDLLSGSADWTSDTAAQPPPPAVGGVGLDVLLNAGPSASSNDATGVYAALAAGSVVLALAAGALYARTRPRRR